MTPAELARLFRAERRRFARHFPAVGRAQLYIGRRPRGEGARAFGVARLPHRGQPGAPRVTLYREALRLPLPFVLGLVRHELGHVADARVGRKGGEQRADDIAHAVTGERIRYAAVGRARAVQTVGRGRWPRPCYLHQ